MAQEHDNLDASHPALLVANLAKRLGEVDVQTSSNAICPKPWRRWRRRARQAGLFFHN
jgi:hypothetical protein